MMFKRSNTLPAKKAKFGVNKLVLGFAALAATAVIGATGLAAASPSGKPSKAQCAAAGYKNYGQCVKDWAKNKPGGPGYGGNHSNININLKVNGSNNIIQIIINVFK